MKLDTNDISLAFILGALLGSLLTWGKMRRHRDAKGRFMKEND